MIPTYPDFCKLEISHKDDIEKITSQYEPYSDFNFTSLACWNIGNTTELSILHKNLVVKMKDYTSNEEIITFIGNEDIDLTISDLLNTYKDLVLIPEQVAVEINDSKYRLTEDRDQFDYIYKIEDIVQMKGGKWKKKRNKNNAILKMFEGRLKSYSTEQLNDEFVVKIKAIFNTWVKQTTQPKENYLSEITAFKNLLHYRHKINLIWTLIMLDDEPAGFSVNEKLASNFGICHFEKSLNIHPDIYTYIALESSKALLEKNCKYVNWEQDLGIEGLRSAKMNFHPDKFLKKFTVDLV